MESAESGAATPTLPDRTRPNTPVAVSISCTNGSVNSGDSATINASWTGVTDLPAGMTTTSGISYYKVEKQINGTYTFVSNVSHTGTGTHSVSISNQPDQSTFRIKVTAYDKNGNYSDSRESSAISSEDRTAPSQPATVTINPAVWTKNTSPTISWTGVTDNVGITNIQYSISGGTWTNTGVSTGSGSKTISLSHLADGSHTIALRGIDAKGNYGASKAVNYLKDVTLPTVSMGYPIHNQIINGIVNVVGSVNDAHLSNWKLEYGLGASPSSYTTLSTGTGNVSSGTLFSWDTSPLSNQAVYTIRLTGNDTAGNSRSTALQVVKSEDTISSPPELQIDSPLNGSTIVSQHVNIAYQRINNGGNTGLTGKLYINEELIDTEGSSGEGLVFDASEYPEGSENDLYVKADDGSGNDLYSTMSYESMAMADTFTDMNKLGAYSQVSNTGAGSIVLMKNGSVYYAQGSLESKPVTVAEKISSIRLLSDENKPSGTNIQYQASVDGGVTWFPISRNVKTEPPETGSTLKLRAILSTTNTAVTPELLQWEVETVSVHSGMSFRVKLIDEPENLTAAPNINYMTLLRWTASTTQGVTYHIYRSKTENFNIQDFGTLGADIELVAQDLTDNYWNDFNLNYGQTFYYKVVAVKEFNGELRESLPSNESWAKVVDESELTKRLGLQDYWGYSAFRTGSGNGYVNVSSGNLVYQSTDFVYPGPRLAMVMRKSYNNQSTTKTPLGYGWDFSFNTCLMREYDTNGMERGLLLKDGDGTIHRFAKNPDGTYSSPKGIYMELINHSDGTYTIKRNDSIEYLFNKNMKLTKFTEPNGNYLNMYYDVERGNLSVVENNVEKQVLLTYDSADRLISINDPAGRVFHYVYDESSDRLVKSYTVIEDSVEYAEEYVYDTAYQQIQKIKDPMDKGTSIDYIDGRVTKITDSEEEYHSFQYITGTTEISSNRGRTISFYYNTDGNITKKTDPLGHSINYEYDSNFNVTRMHYINKINGVDTTLNHYYTYDSKGNLLTVKDPLNNTTEYNNYNSRNQVGEIKAPISAGVYAITQYTYDTKGNLLTATDPEGRLVTHTYDSTKFGNRVTTTDNFGNTTTYSYDDEGRLVKTKEPLDRITEVLSYDAQGNPTKVKDGNGNVTEYEYDLLGRNTKTIYPDGNFEETTYDLNSNVKQYQNRRGFTTSYSYDSLDRIIYAAYPDGKTNAISYGFEDDSNNELVIYTDGEGRVKTEYYDLGGRLFKEEMGDSSTTYEYDYIGNMVKSTDADGHIATAKYDMLNRNTHVITDPTGVSIVTEFTYDLMGNRISVKDGEGNVTNYQYDRINRLKNVSQTVEGQTIQTSYTYDISEGSLVRNKVTDALGREKITYLDALGRAVKEVDKGVVGDDSRMTKEYQYDFNNNLKKLIQNDGTDIDYTYNNLNLLTRIDYEANSYTEFTYDLNGNRQKMKDTQNGITLITSYSYDSMDRLDQVQQDGHTVNYEYDGSDNVVRVFYPMEEGDLERDIEYIYDSGNRLKKILNESKTVQEYFYTRSGMVDYVKNYRQFDTAGTGYVKVDYSYNTAGMPINIQYLDNGTVRKEEYTMSYDKRGFITGETVFTDYDGAKTVNKSYSYDAIGRLTTSVEGTKTTSFTYDKAGNRLTMNDGTDTLAYSYNQFNSLTEVKKNGTVDATYQYDARGNQTKEISKKDFGGTLKDVTSNFSYDIGNRLVGTTITATGETTQNITNHFNGDGQRIKQTINGLVIKYYYVGANLLYTTDHNNVKGQEHILDPAGSIVASKRFDGAYDNMYFFYNYDIRGSVTNIIKPDGSRVKGYEYDEFGNTKEVGESQFKNDVKFTGAVHDTSTGLYYMNARFYNPSSGRFLSQDSHSGDPQEPWTQHLYAYCGNNPINMIDPTGHWPQWLKDIGNGIKKATTTVVNFFSPNTNTKKGDFQEGPFIGSYSLTGGYSEIMLRGQTNKQVVSSNKEASSTIGVFTKISGGNVAGKSRHRK